MFYIVASMRLAGMAPGVPSMLPDPPPHPPVQELCSQYWPSEVGEAKQFGRVTVELTSEDSPRAEYVVRKLRVWQENKQEEGRLVTQFHFLQWPQGGCPDSATPVVELVNDLQRVQRQSGNRPITVQCSDGVDRTGAFCALVTALERVKTEQIVDVFKTVISLRIQRLGMVTTAVSKTLFLGVSRTHGKAPISYLLCHAVKPDQWALYHLVMVGMVLV